VRSSLGEHSFAYAGFQRILETSGSLEGREQLRAEALKCGNRTRIVPALSERREATSSSRRGMKRTSKPSRRGAEADQVIPLPQRATGGKAASMGASTFVWSQSDPFWVRPSLTMTRSREGTIATIC
jgi:hypothetical protein